MTHEKFAIDFLNSYSENLKNYQQNKNHEHKMQIPDW